MHQPLLPYNVQELLQGEHRARNSDGIPYRGYLYAPDLAEWLVADLHHDTSGKAVNVTNRGFGVRFHQTA
jgi:nucleoside-diphosphate-sugar epimerase